MEVAGANRRWRGQLAFPTLPRVSGPIQSIRCANRDRCRGSRRESAVAQLFSLGGITRVMDSETWTQNLDETVALISRWRGSTAIAEQYIAGHGRFLLRLVRQDGTRRSAYLQCGDCQVIQLFRTQWTDADISISSAPHRLGTVFTITDPGRFHLVCWSVFATETERRVIFEYPPNAT